MTLRTILPWLLKAVLSAAYWLFAFSAVIGLAMGERMTANGVEAANGPWTGPLTAIAAVLLWAALSYAFDRAVARWWRLAIPPA